MNQKIKGEREELFDQSFLSGKTELDSSFVWEGIPAPTNIAILKDRFLKEGFDEIERVYRELKENGNLQPFSRSFYKDYRSWLAWQKDEDYTYRQRLYDLAYDSYPESARMNYYLAYYSKRVGQNEKAIQTLLTTISYDETNSTAYYSLGLIYAEQNDLVRSIEYLTKTKDYDPYNERAFYNLAKHKALRIRLDVVEQSIWGLQCLSGFWTLSHKRR